MCTVSSSLPPSLLCQLEPQEKIPGVSKRSAEYVGSSSGASSFLSVGELCCSMIQHLFNHPWGAIKTLEEKFSQGSLGLTLVRLQAKTYKVYEALQDMSEEGDVSTERKAVQASQNLMSAMSSWCKAAAIFSAHIVLKQVRKITGLVESLTDTCCSLKDYHTALVYEGRASGAMKEALSHTKKYHMLQIASSVFSVVSGVLTGLLFFFGTEVLSGATLTGFLLLSMLIGIRGEFFKEEGAYKLIDLTKVRESN